MLLAMEMNGGTEGAAPAAPPDAATPTDAAAAPGAAEPKRKVINMVI